MHEDFAADRYVVRVRRRADLSQRELAEVLGVSKSFVERVESSRNDIAVKTMSRILGVAGLRLAVLDRTGHEVDPVSAETVRDNAGRRFPAHLDVDPPDLVPPLRRLLPRYDRPPARGWYRLRPERDRLRLAMGVPADHPTIRELAERGRQSARDRWGVARSRRASVEWPEWTQCDCDTACWLGTVCETECPCQCEPSQLVGPA